MAKKLGMERICEDPPSLSSGSPVEDENCSRKQRSKKTYKSIIALYSPARWVWTTGKVKEQHWSKSISDCN